MGTATKQPAKLLLTVQFFIHQIAYIISHAYRDQDLFRADFHFPQSSLRSRNIWGEMCILYVMAFVVLRAHYACTGIPVLFKTCKFFFHQWHVAKCALIMSKKNKKNPSSIRFSTSGSGYWKFYLHLSS